MRRTLVAPALVLLALSIQAKEPLRVLFLGNSYTYFNNAPAIFTELARAALPGREIEARMVTVPGATLLSLWERSEARRVLHSSKWDYVVLQDQSMLGDALRDGQVAVNSPLMLHWGARLFDADIRKAGARTALMLTWARRARPDQQAHLNYAYDSIARELGATLLPVGPAWQEARRRLPDLELYAEDGSHPSPAGSYLLACVAVASLLPATDRELPARVMGRPAIGGGIVDGSRASVLVSLEPSVAKQLQAVARRAVGDLKRSGGYLNAQAPERPGVTPVERGALDVTQLAGAWSGALTYYPDAALLELNLRFEGDKCQGEAVVRVPARRQRYDAPLAECSLAGQELRFTLATPPLPSLVDRFTGWLSGGQLGGTVERAGRDFTHAMTGTWTLRRQADAPAH